MALTKITGQVINTATDVTVGVLTVTDTLAIGGTVSIGGTLTYEDVTNIDSVGLITARNGIVVGSGITLSKDGDIFATGVTTATKFVGDGSELTGVASTENIRTNTNATFLQNINVSGTSTVSGKFFLGHDSSRTVGDRTHLLQIEGTALQDGGLSMVRNRNDEHSTSITLAKTRGSSTGANTIVQSGDSIGEFAFAAGDGTDVVTRAGRIHCEIDGTPGANDMPGRLILSTTADGAASPSPRLTIDSTGHLLHGVTASEDTTGNSGTKLITTGDLQIDGDQKAIVFRPTASTAQKQSGLQWWNESGAGVQCAIFGIRESVSQAPGALAFYTSDNVDSSSNNGEGEITERFRIDSSGHVLPGANDTYDLGSSSKRWRDIYTGDLNLSNKGKSNDVDGSWGDYTIQEGESDLFLINNRSGKKFKFNLTEVS